MLDLVYRENLTLTEVAQKTGVHPNTAQRRHVNALDTMRVRLMREAPGLARERLGAAAVRRSSAPASPAGLPGRGPGRRRP